MVSKRLWIALMAVPICVVSMLFTGAEKLRPASAGGVTDPTCTSLSPCIEYDNNGTGPGIRGISLAGNGLSGSTKNKSTSTASGRAGLIGNDVGTGSFNSGVHGLSVNGVGVSGNSTRGDGVDGTSTSRNGVQGISASTFASGVYGQGSTSFGVAGRSTSGVGVFGQSTSGIAVQGTSASFVGVDAVGGNFVLSTGHDDPALSIIGDTSSTPEGSVRNDLIDACPPGSADPCDSANGIFGVRGFGDVYSAGSIDILGKYLQGGGCVAGCGASATSVRRVQTYSLQSSQPMIEDNGEAQLVSGVAYVRVDPAFANVIDQRTIYSVSITPEGNSNGLFVTQKTMAGFSVRENNGGRSTLAFEYRIVAKPYGSIAKRLPMVDIPLRRTIGARSWHSGGAVPVH